MLSERCGSTLRRTKTCLRDTIIHENLNYSVLSIDTDKADLLNLALITNEFLEANSEQVQVFQ